MDGPVSGRLPGAVLFACNFNAVRSPMAAGLMHHLYGQKVFVASAGVRAGELDGFAVAAMEEIGIDISAHEPTTISELHDTSFDVVISLAPEAHHKAMEMTRTMAIEAEYWPTHDPTIIEGTREQRMTGYRQVRDDLLRQIKTRFDFQPAPSG